MYGPSETAGRILANIQTACIRHFPQLRKLYRSGMQACPPCRFGFAFCIGFLLISL